MGATKDLIARNQETWNAHDRGGWVGDFTSDAKLIGPGGMAGSGPEMAGRFYDIWQSGFPDCNVEVVTIAEDGDAGTLEAVFHGTHSGPLAAPAGTIEATGKKVSVPFVVVHRVAEDKFAAFSLYFDQLGMLGQLGVLPG